MVELNKKTMRLDSFLSQEGTAPTAGGVRLNDYLAQDDVRQARSSFVDYLDAAGKGISKAIGSAPGVAADIMRVSIDSIAGKGADKEAMFDPVNWTDYAHPISVVARIDRKIRQKLFSGTDIDEKIADWSDKLSDVNKQFIQLGFPGQESKALQFVEDLGSGAISLGSAIVMGMIAGPIAPGIVFGVMAKAIGYKEALDSGKSYSEAQLISSLLGIVEGGLEFWGVHRLISGSGGVIKRGIKGMLTEFIQEFSQTGAEGLIKYFTDIEKQTFMEIIFRSLYAGSIGAVLGGSSAITVASIQKHQVKKSLIKAGLKESTAEQKTNEIFNKAGEDVFAEAQKVLTKTFEETQKESNIIVKATAGETLTAEETETLENIYDEFVQEGLIEVKEEAVDSEQKIKDVVAVHEKVEADLGNIVSKNQWEQADVAKKVSLLYKGREKQLDQRRIAIEKQMTTLEKQVTERSEQKKSTKAIQNKLNTLSKELESIHFQIADLEDTAVARLEKEGILIGGKDLESLRKSAFRQGEIALRKDLMSKIKAKKQEKETRAKAIKKITKQPKKPENVVDVKYQERINAILSRVGGKKELNKMSTDELTVLAEEISELKTKGREVFKSKKEQKRMASEILRASLLKEIGGLPDGTFSKGTVEETKAKKTSARRRITLANIRPLRFIREVFGKVGERLVYDPIDHSWTQKISNDISRQTKVQESIDKNNVSGMTLGKKIEFNGKQYQVNKILAMYIFQKDAHAYQMLQQGNNLTENEINGFINVVKESYPSYLKFADDVQVIVAERFEELNSIMQTYYNISMEKVTVYFPLHVMANNPNDPNLYGDIEACHVYEQALRKGEGFTYSSPYKDMTISRKEIGENFSSEISLNFLSDAYNAISNQEHLIAFAHLQKAFNKIINDKEIQDAVKYNYSQKAWKDFNEYLNVNVNPHLMFNGGDSVWVKRLRQGLAKAYLGFNVVTAAKQLPSALAAMKYTSVPQLIKSMSAIIFTKKAKKKVYTLDPSLKNRIVTRDFKEMLEVVGNLPEGDIKRALLLASKKLDKAAFTMIMQMDKIAVLSVYDAVYEHQRKTLSEAEAKDKAHKAVIETQPQGGIKDLPSLYRTNNEYLRMIIMFTNQLNQYWNMQTSDLPMEIRNKQYGQAMSGVASMMIISTMIYIATHGRLPEEPEEFIEAIFGTTFGSIPIAGNIILSLSRGYTPSLSPAAAVLDNMKSAISNVQNENYGEAMKKSLFIVAVWLGLPYSQLRRTAEGSFDLFDGETDDLRRLIWSESMLEPK